MYYIYIYNITIRKTSINYESEKTKIVTTAETQILRLSNQVIENVEKLLNYEREIKLLKSIDEFSQKLTVVGKLSHVLKDKKIPINLKR